MAFMGKNGLIKQRAEAIVTPFWQHSAWHRLWRRRVILALPLLAFILLAFGLFLGLFKDPQSLPSTLIGKAAPALSLPLYAPAVPIGQSPKISLASLAQRGTKRTPLVINFFASWCIPCRVEAGALMMLRQKRDEARLDFQIIGIAYKDRPENTAQFLRDYGNPFDQVLLDQDGRGGIEFGVYGIPETFLVTASGLVDRRYTGALRVDPDIGAILSRFGRHE